MTKNSVTINGNVYDAKSGSILSARPSGRSPAAAASDFHNSTQKSRTLQRKYINKPRVIDSVASTSRSTQPRQLTVAERTPRIIHHSERVRAAQDTQRSTSITRFAKEPPVKHPDVADTPDIAPTTNHLEQVARQRQTAIKKQQQPRAVLPSQVIKQQAIQEATAKMVPRQQRKEIKPARNSLFWQRLVSVGSVTLAVLLIGAYFTYINMPALSTRVAAAQAGINASYPGYRPSGYSLDGPVAYQQGSVIMKFAANGSKENFTLAQTRSEWDSSAVLENYVKPKSNNKYSTTTTNGLTIYTYGTNAAWVNAGILYTVNGDAELAPEQVQKLATSL